MYKYNIPTVNFITLLRERLTRYHRAVIGADTNAHSKLWFCDDKNARGLKVEDIIEEFDLKNGNKRHPLTTHRHGMGKSNIDVTITTEIMEESIRDWKILEDITDSDHRVTFTLITDIEQYNSKEISKRFNVDKADWNKFADKLRFLEPLCPKFHGDINREAAQITKLILKAAKGAIPRSGTKTRSRKPPWWNDILDGTKKELGRSRRALKRDLNNEELRGNFRRCRNTHLAQIRAAKSESWRSFSNDININKWGKAFKWTKKGPVNKEPPSLMRDDAGSMTATQDDTARVLLNRFVPNDPNNI